MAFSRARVSRFNEVPGCAPPPGTYDPRFFDKPPLGYFDKSKRFIEMKRVIVPYTPPPPPRQRKTSLETPRYLMKRGTPNLRRSNTVSNRPLRKAVNVRCRGTQTKPVIDNLRCNGTQTDPVIDDDLRCELCSQRAEKIERQTEILRTLKSRLDRDVKMIQLIIENQENWQPMMNQLAEHYQFFVGKLNDFKTSNEELALRLITVQNETIDYRLKVCELKDCVDELTAVKGQIEMERSKLQDDVVERELRIRMCEEKLETVKKNLADELKNNESLKGKADFLALELKSNQDRHSEVVKNIVQYQSTFSKMEEQNNTLQAELRNQRAQHEKEIKFAKSEQKKVADLLCVVQERLETKDQQVSDLTEELNSVQINFRNAEQLHGMTMGLLPPQLKELLKVIHRVCRTMDPEQWAEELMVGEDEPYSHSSQGIKAYLGAISGGVMVIEKLASSRGSILEMARELKDKDAKIRTLELLIGPFREQLEQYEQERKALEDITVQTRGELQKISLQQAAALGHQNHKQKIRYMVQLKQTNLHLKDEIIALNTKLRQKDRRIARLARVIGEDVSISRRSSIDEREDY